MNTLWLSRGVVVSSSHEGTSATRESSPSGRAEQDANAEESGGKEPIGGPPNDSNHFSANTTRPPSTVTALRPFLQCNTRPQPQPPESPLPAVPQGATPSPQPSQLSGPNEASMTLAQVRAMVADFPRTQTIAYDYVYADTGPIAEEVDEWFVYSFCQWMRLNAAHQAFTSLWSATFGQSAEWESVRIEDQKQIVCEALRVLQQTGPQGSDGAALSSPRADAVGVLLYVVLGRWVETVRDAAVPAVGDAKVRTLATKEQLEQMKAGVELVAVCDGIPTVWSALTKAFEVFWAEDIQQHQHQPQHQSQGMQLLMEDMINLMTILYIIIVETIDTPNELAWVREKLVSLAPSPMNFFFHVTTRLRWEEATVLPQTQIFLLLWKSLLLTLGGSKELERAKRETSETTVGEDKKDLIRASPLDYHVFRREITSKYPAYIAPQPVIPLEAEQTSLLPQLPNHPTRNNGSSEILLEPSSQCGGASILNQPVHIATPAPSPPPSPSMGGKGSKKQNYQTNQNLPFMYPPLDASSNSAGGKGAAGRQKRLVGRKWEGSDVPASILEAGELFSTRVRMTRATRQLWDEREKFLKFDRGWEGDSDVLDDLDLSSLTVEEKEELGLARLARPTDEQPPRRVVDFGPKGDALDLDVKSRLVAVDAFYKEALPHLQSLVVVLLKVIMTIATNVPPGQSGPQQTPQQAQTQQQQSQQPGLHHMHASTRVLEGLNTTPSGVNGAAKEELPSPADEALDELRNCEISAKAVTGILMLLLKWFKISHVLKLEYLTQLLLDANYIPLALKVFVLHDISQVVESRPDRIEHSFFYFCGCRAGPVPSSTLVSTTEFEEDSGDDAAPPPIRLQRSPPSPQAHQQQQTGSGIAVDSSHPEVDELGYPINPLPHEPITDFSRRNFFTTINYLRIMQKVCKHKAHRNLLLVHYKSANILRKTLKVPQQELRLYTLKLFKNQVPYCGRKWRQSNMRVITAVYLHCRPELREEWLAGSDVDAEVEEALPLEQALRSLTYWFNIKGYPEGMPPEACAQLAQESDFFRREMAKIDLGWGDGDGDDGSVRLEWEDAGWA